MRMNEYEAHDPGKDAFHRKYRKALKAFAKRLGLAKGTYEVRSCKGGPAVLGEVTLHSATLYMMVHRGFTGEDYRVLYRSCKGRKDYCGGQNLYMPVAALETDSGLEAAKSVAGL